MGKRLIANWVYGGILAGLLLLLLGPVLTAGWAAPGRWVYVLLPAYMVHQYEEHDADRFRAFFNATLGGGHQVLTPLAVFVTNVPGVWGVIGLALWLTRSLSPGLGLIAADLVLVNAAVHIIHAGLYRRYNPGLATAVLVFLPLGGAAYRALGEGASLAQAGLGVAVALGIHAAILGHALRRRHALRAAAAAA